MKWWRDDDDGVKVYTLSYTAATYVHTSNCDLFMWFGLHLQNWKEERLPSSGAYVCTKASIDIWHSMRRVVFDDVLVLLPSKKQNPRENLTRNRQNEEI